MSSKKPDWERDTLIIEPRAWAYWDVDHKLFYITVRAAYDYVIDPPA